MQCLRDIPTTMSLGAEISLNKKKKTLPKHFGGKTFSRKNVSASEQFGAKKAYTQNVSAPKFLSLKLS